MPANDLLLASMFYLGLSCGIAAGQALPFLKTARARNCARAATVAVAVISAAGIVWSL